MGNIFLHAFISKVRENRRLLYGDLQRLQRDVLPNGISTRAEAEALIALNGVLERSDEGWPGYLTGVVKEFVLSCSQPRGSIDPDTAAWLVSALAALPSRTAVEIARELVREARHADEALLAFSKKGSKGKPKARTAMACRRAPDPCISYWPEQVYEWGSISVSIGTEIAQAETPPG
jgi:hypothetical protein